MAGPKFNHGTCRICGKRVVYKAQELSPEQQAENDAVEKTNEGKRRWDTDYQYPPHQRFFEVRWTHMPEEPGQNNVFCDPEEAAANVYYRKRAAPREFCLERLQNGGICHKQAKMEVDGIGYCLYHGKQKVEEQERREQMEQENALRQWAKEALQERADAIKEKYGIEVGETYGYNDSVEVDAKQITELAFPGELDDYEKTLEDHKMALEALVQIYTEARDTLLAQQQETKNAMQEKQKSLAQAGFQGSNYGRHRGTYRISIEQLEEFLAGHQRRT